MFSGMAFDWMINWVFEYNPLYSIIFILAMAVFLCEFWGQYVLVMGLYRIYLQDKVTGVNRLTGVNKVFGITHLIKGVIIDVFANVFVAIFWFTPWREVWMNPLKWEWPREFLVTQRLTRYLDTMPKESLQYRRAYWICHRSLDVFDPNGDHCHDKVSK